MNHTATDVIFSQLVRERAGWRCENCFQSFASNHGGLDCSHFVGGNRGKVSTRFYPQNACALCRTCHDKLGVDKKRHEAFMETYLEKHYPPGAVEALRLRQAKIVKLSAPKRKDVLASLKSSLTWMLRQRAEGAEGRLDFDSPYP